MTIPIDATMYVMYSKPPIFGHHQFSDAYNIMAIIICVPNSRNGDVGILSKTTSFRKNSW